MSGDESWFPVYDPLSHRQSLEWMPYGGWHTQIPGHERATIKVMIAFFDC